MPVAVGLEMFPAKLQTDFGWLGKWKGKQRAILLVHFMIYGRSLMHIMKNIFNLRARAWHPSHWI